MTTIEHIMRALRGEPLPRTPEAALQLAISAQLTGHGFAHTREVRLGEGDIIDFLVEPALGLEVKVDGSASDVTRQLHRYAQSPLVTELLLITTRAKHRSMPPALNGKPICVLHLLGAAL